VRNSSPLPPAAADRATSAAPAPAAAAWRRPDVSILPVPAAPVVPGRGGRRRDRRVRPSGSLLRCVQVSEQYLAYLFRGRNRRTGLRPGAVRAAPCVPRRNLVWDKVVGNEGWAAPERPSTGTGIATFVPALRTIACCAETRTYPLQRRWCRRAKHRLQKKRHAENRLPDTSARGHCGKIASWRLQPGAAALIVGRRRTRPDGGATRGRYLVSLPRGEPVSPEGRLVPGASVEVHHGPPGGHLIVIQVDFIQPARRLSDDHRGRGQGHRAAVKGSQEIGPCSAERPGQPTPEERLCTRGLRQAGAQGWWGGRQPRGLFAARRPCPRGRVITEDPDKPTTCLMVCGEFVATHGGGVRAESSPATGSETVPGRPSLWPAA
jgi:hypothetical protein